MAVPTPDVEYTDLTDAAFVDSGSPIDTAHPITGLLTGKTYDGIADWSDTDLEPVPASSGGNISGAFWFNSNETGTGFVAGQRGNSVFTNAVWNVFFIGGKLSVYMFSSATAYTLSKADENWSDGQDHYLTWAASAGNVDIFVDGSEVTYNAQNTNVGAGFSTVKSGTVADLHIAAYDDGSVFGDVAVFPMKFWLSDTLTEAQASELYISETGTGGGSSAYGGISTLIAQPVASRISDGVVG